MRISTTIAIAIGLGALAACDTERDPQEQRAENIVENAEMRAENIMESAENRAENIVESAENRAENMTNEAGETNTAETNTN